MNIRVRNTTENFNSYRAARVKSLFNAEDGSHFNLDAELNISDPDWRIGVIVGPSGSGKTSIDQPPLHRPDLPELGNGGWSGYTVVVDGLDARTPPAPTPDDDEYWIGAAGRLGGFAPRP